MRPVVRLTGKEAHTIFKMHGMKIHGQLLSAGFFFLFTGCVTLYKPNSIHSPMLREKGELSTAASLGLSGCGLYNLQAAYAVSHHTGVMMDGMYHNRRFSSSDGSVEKLNIVSGEAGAGYFTFSGLKRNGLLQIYGGGGYGFTTDKMVNTGQPGPEVNARFFNVFVQPGYAYTTRNFEAAVDLRANYVHLYDIHAYLYGQFEWWNTDFHYYSDTTLDFIILEPAVTIRAGGEKLKGVFQFGLTVPAYHSDSYFILNTSSRLVAPLVKFSVGINYTFGRKRIQKL